MSLCTSLALYSPEKGITVGECASVLCHMQSATHRKVAVLHIAIWQLLHFHSYKHRISLRFPRYSRDLVCFRNAGFSVL